jgi:hypothetical protein
LAGRLALAVGAGLDAIGAVRVQSKQIVRSFQEPPLVSAVPYQADMRVKVSPTELYTYPDVTVVCAEPQFEDAEVDTLLNPTVLVEVLSPSTADYDRGGKFAHYRRLASLQEYVLISQDRPLVEHYVRRGSDQWLLTEQRGLEDTLVLPSIGCLAEPSVRFVDTHQLGVEVSAVYRRGVSIALIHGQLRNTCTANLRPDSHGGLVSSIGQQKSQQRSICRGLGGGRS